jgi:uncharacterized membrane protein
MSVLSIKHYLGDERRVHALFRVSLWLKGAFALAEILAGVAAFFVSKPFLLNFVLWITKSELNEDPHDFGANLMLHSVRHLSAGTQRFAGVYLLGHGAIKLWLIIGLLRERLWYFPTALALFALFIVYQLYRYAFTHSIWLLAVTTLDLIVIALTWHEWRYLRTRGLHRK